MLLLAAALSVLYAFVNTFAAWMSIRRKPPLAMLFMLAAALLMIGAAALGTAIPYARVLLGSGLVLASIASLLHARIVVGTVIVRNHVIRLAFAAALFALAHAALVRNGTL